MLKILLLVKVDLFAWIIWLCPRNHCQ